MQRLEVNQSVLVVVIVYVWVCGCMCICILRLMCISIYLMCFLCPFSFHSRKYNDVFAEALSAVVPKLQRLKRLQ